MTPQMCGCFVRFDGVATHPLAAVGDLCCVVVQVDVRLSRDMRAVHWVLKSICNKDDPEVPHVVFWAVREQ